jgi:hypothetical protein
MLVLKRPDLDRPRPLHPLEEFWDYRPSRNGASDPERCGDIDRPADGCRRRGGHSHASLTRHVSQGQPAYLHRIAQLSTEGDATGHTLQNPSRAASSDISTQLLPGATSTTDCSSRGG